MERAAGLVGRVRGELGDRIAQSLSCAGRPGWGVRRRVLDEMRRSAEIKVQAV